MTKTTPADEMIRTLQSLEEEWMRANRSLAAVMPKEMAGAFNLMTQPAALASASTILGVGAASHAAGLWMNAWLGAAENMQKVMAAPLGKEVEEASRQASTRARAAADTLIAEARSLAEEVTKPVTVPAAAQSKRATSKAPAKASPAAVSANEATAMPVAMPKPDKPDDLKAISGVGPKLEQVLNSLGIWTYDQIAALTAAEIDWIEDYLSFKGRIGRDDWQGQARKLGGGAA